jgi:hypothetical protein
VASGAAVGAGVVGVGAGVVGVTSVGAGSGVSVSTLMFSPLHAASSPANITLTSKIQRRVFSMVSRSLSFWVQC